MDKQERQEWILGKIKQIKYADVLNAEFVADYISATGAAYVPQPFGASKCKWLGSDLGELFKNGKLKRSSIGLQNAEWGFPKWVYVYEIV